VVISAHVIEYSHQNITYCSDPVAIYMKLTGVHIQRDFRKSERKIINVK